MLTVEEYGEIRRAHRDGQSIRAIARQQHSRRKVHEALAASEPRKKPAAPPKLDAFKPIREPRFCQRAEILGLSRIPAIYRFGGSFNHCFSLSRRVSPAAKSACGKPRSKASAPPTAGFALALIERRASRPYRPAGLLAIASDFGPTLNDFSTLDPFRRALPAGRPLVAQLSSGA
jgi:hypothetical protein